MKLNIAINCLLRPFCHEFMVLIESPDRILFDFLQKRQDVRAKIFLAIHGIMLKTCARLGATRYDENVLSCSCVKKAFG